MGRENKWFYASIMAAVFAAGAGFHPALAAGITIGTLAAGDEGPNAGG